MSTSEPTTRREQDDAALTAAIYAALDGVKDPCHVLSGYDLSILDLGLVNRVDRVGDIIEVGLTFTDATCVFAYKIIQELEDLVPSLPGINAVKVISEPFPLWDESRLSAKARALYADSKSRFGLAQVTAQGRSGARSCGDAERRHVSQPQTSFAEER